MMKSASPYSKDLSFVIIGRNAEWSIARLLDSVIARTAPRITSEIIYVDSASTDRTIEIVGRYPAKIVRLSTEQPLCASAGRFVGTHYAGGRYIAFFDSDMELLDGWTEKAVDLLDGQPQIAVVSGIQVDYGPIPGTEVRGSTDGVPYLTGGCRDIKFAGSAAIFRREVFERVGTWNPFIISDEEPELCLRIRHAGYQIVELAWPSVRHFGYSPPTLSALFARRRRRLFLGFGQVIRYHLRTGLLWAYLRERGWVALPLLTALAAMVAVLVSFLSGKVLWLAGFLCAIGVAFGVDVIRSRNLYTATFHAFHRMLILEGTIKGFLLHPRPPNEYPSGARLLKDEGRGTAKLPSIVRRSVRPSGTAGLGVAQKG